MTKEEFITHMIKVGFTPAQCEILHNPKPGFSASWTALYMFGRAPSNTIEKLQEMHKHWFEKYYQAYPETRPPE